MGVYGVGCVMGMRYVQRWSHRCVVGVNGDRCPEEICCAKTECNEDTVKNICCGIEWVEDEP